MAPLKTSLSKSVRFFTGSQRKSRKVPVHARPNEEATRRAASLRIFGAMTQEARVAALDLDEPDDDGFHDIPMHFDPDSDHSDDSGADRDNRIQSRHDRLCALPPGDEAAGESGEGGETALLQEMESVVRPRKDYRTRRDRVQRLIDKWRSQKGPMTEAIEEFTAYGAPEYVPQDGDIRVHVYTMNGIHEQTFPNHHETAITHNVTLARHGFIGGSPDIPSTAFSIHALSWFRQLNRVCPRLSDDAFCEALHHHHELCVRANVAAQFRIAYDCYLEIVRGVQDRVRASIGINSSASHTRSLCPPCSYELKQEHPLHPRKLFSMDGNNSLKMMDSAYRAGEIRSDNRTVSSYRWIEDIQVNRFKDEVKRRPPRKETGDIPHEDRPPPEVPGDDDDASSPDPADVDGDFGELLDGTVKSCVEKWKAASPEEQKRMFAIFAIAGIFVTVCRHGHVHAICDMVRSGELMKYPLAHIEKLLDDHGPEVRVGYDIYCAFHTTLANSCLGERVASMKLTGVVPAFHGHAHCRRCQLNWHPLFVDGSGLEDHEECERCFSISNHLAPTTRLSTVYHRRMRIEEHFDFHDEDKHIRSATFIYNNYKQALDKIQAGVPALERMCRDLKINPDTLDADIAAERAYFDQEVKDTATYETFEVEYYKLLLSWWQTKEACTKARVQHTSYTDVRGSDYSRSEDNRLAARARTSSERADKANDKLLDFEEDNRIPVRWAPTSEEANKASGGLTLVLYLQALDRLERALVSRYQEMAKIKGGTGYKQRMKIANALRARASAVRTALQQYNVFAGKLGRSKLTWIDITTLISNAEFDLLRDPSNHADNDDRPWTKPARRSAAVLHLEIRRAREEIVRLNVETTRLWTFMADEHVDFTSAISATKSSSPLFAHTIERRALYRAQVHSDMASRLRDLAKLPGFSGSLSVGHAVHRSRKTLAFELPSYLQPSITYNTSLEPYEDPDAEAFANLAIIEAATE